MWPISNTKAISLALFFALPCFAGTFYSVFPVTESPVDQHGFWINGKQTGLDWSNCVVNAGFIYGTQDGSGTGNGQYTDSRAQLTGTWGATQMVSAVVKVYNQAAATVGQEVELWVHSSISAHSITGYEIDYSVCAADPYVAIARWDGALGNYVILGAVDFTHYAQSGDTISGLYSNGVVYLYINGSLIISRSDSTYTTGNPGIGFFLDNNNGTTSPGNSTNFGFNSFMATDWIHSVTNPAPSLSVTDVMYMAQVVSTNCGDVVTAPAETNTWLSALTITNPIWLIGGGTNSGTRSLVLDGCSGASTISWAVAGNCTSYWTGFYFTNALASSDFNPFLGLTGIDDLRRIRVYGNVFDKLFRVMGFFNSVYGVFDHNVFIGPTYGQPAFLGYVKGNYLGSTVGVNIFGDGAWTNALGFGGEKFLFFESNTFTNAYNGNLTMLDAQAGARYVVRSNTANGGSWESHGLEAQRERSGEAFEIYGNTNGGYGDRQTYIYHRGGVGVVWGNTIRGWGNGANFGLLNNRTRDGLAEPFGPADGRNPWDTNSTSNPFVTGTCSGSSDLTMTDGGKSWTVNQWAGYILRKTSGTAVQSMSRSGTTVTVNANGHGYVSGQWVSVFQQPYTVNSEQPYEVELVQATVVNANQFTFQITSTPSSPATATYLTCSNNYCSEITSNSATTLGFKSTIYLGSFTPVVTNMTFAVGTTYEINKLEHAMDQPGRTDGANVGGADTPSLPAGWNNQTTDPWYGWSNTNLDNNSDVFFNPDSRTIITNIHFISGTPRPGYAPYQWPHNLVGPAQSTPGAPQAVLVGPFILQGPAKIGSL